MTVTEIQSKAEFDKLLKSHRTVIIDASAESSGPSRMLSQFFNKHAAESEYDDDKLAFVRIDAETIPDLADQLEIRSLPAFLVFVSGELPDHMTQTNPRALGELVYSAVERSEGEGVGETA